MANPWFRMYSEFATDPKVQRLSEVEQRRFLMVLCLRCSNGDVTLHDEDVVFQLRISPEEWESTKSVLQSKNLIDEDNKPIAWEKRQFASDTSAARVAKHRELQKTQSNSGVTLQKPQGNALDTDTDTDTDTDKKKRKAAAFALPNWIDKSMWDLWMQTRKGKKMIPAQMQAQVNKLQAWKDRGMDYAAALTASAEAGWAGLFEPKPTRGGAATSQSDNEQIREAARKRLFGNKEPEIETI